MKSLKTAWDAMLEWRQWATSTPERAKVQSRRSLREFLLYSLRLIDGRYGTSPFWQFRSMLTAFFKAVNRRISLQTDSGRQFKAYNPQISTALALFLRLSDWSVRELREDLDVGRIAVFIRPRGSEEESAGYLR